MKHTPLQDTSDCSSTIVRLPVRGAGVVSTAGRRRTTAPLVAPTEAEANAMLLAVLTALSEASEPEAATSQVLEITAGALGADVAELWTVGDHQESIVLSQSWGDPGVERGRFETAGRQAPRSPGEGLVGAVWTAGRSAVTAIGDAETAFDRAGAAGHLGLTHALAIPVHGGDNVVAVLAYFFGSTEAPQQAAYTEGWPVARHLGAFLVRAREAAEAKRSIAAMGELAATDPLTGLRNRREFDRAMKAIPRGPFAILSIDVDHLKEANDEHGHEAGDALLRAIGASLGLMIRGSDVLARVGGDEFAAILSNVDAAHTTSVAERCRAAVRMQSLPYGSPQVSIGWAAAGEGCDPAAVWRAADECLYAAKSAGGDRVVGTEQAAGGVLSSSRASSIDLLSVVLVKRNVQTVFQPIINVTDGRALGYEALSRPVGYAPTASIEGLFDAARRTGYLAELDLLCRRAAIKRSAKLPQGSLLFLNISPGMLLKPAHALSHLLNLLAKAGRTPDTTVLEISERERIRDLERLMTVVEGYRREGLRFAVDDLGEGHTTFELMAATRAEFLKVGRSLTVTAARADSTAAIRAALTYAKATNAQVIAEGIEDDVAREAVRALGIVFAQGFALGEPTPVEDVERVIPGVAMRLRPRAGRRAS